MRLARLLALATTVLSYGERNFIHRDFYEDFLFQENMQTEVIRGQEGSFKGTREGLKMDQIGSEICQFLSNGPINKVLLTRIYDFVINWMYLDQNDRNI